MANRTNTCSAGHGLEPWVAKAGVCDGCSAPVRSGDRVMDCRRCDYYLCEACLPQGSAQQQSLWNAFSAIINMEMEVTCKAPAKNEHNDEEIVIEREPAYGSAIACATSRKGGARAYRGGQRRQGADPLDDELVEERGPFTGAGAAATEEPEERQEPEKKEEPEVKAVAPAPMVDLLDLDAPVEVLAAPAGSEGGLVDLDSSALAPAPSAAALAAPKHLEGPVKIQAARLGA